MIKIVHIGEYADKGGAGIVFRNTITALKEYLGEGAVQNYVCCRKTPGLPFEVDLDFGKRPRLSFLSDIYSLKNYRRLKNRLIEIKPRIIHLQSYGNLSPSVLHAIYSYKKDFPETWIIQTTHTFERVCAHFAGFDYRKNVRCLDCSPDKYRFKVFMRTCSRGGTIHSWGKGLAVLIADYLYSKNVIDEVISPSEFLKECMVKRLGKAFPVKVVRNPLEQSFTLASNRPEKRNLIVAYGRISAEKNFDLLIDALTDYHQKYFKKVPVEVRIIGDGMEKEQLQKTAAFRGLDFVKFYSFRKQKELVDLIKDAKVSVLPSKCYETFSMFVTESIALEILPIVPGHGGMLETVNWAGAGICFKGGSARDLSDKIFQGLLNYGEEADKFRSANEKIRQVLTKDNYARQIAHQYNLFLHETNKK